MATAVRGEVILNHPEAIKAERAVITIVAIGRAGSKAVSRKYSDRVPEVRYYCLDTDRLNLDRCHGPEKIHLGTQLTGGLGSGGKPEVGRRAAEESQEEIHRAIGSADLVLILAGMGGGTGSGAAPVIASLAKAAGAHVVAAVTQPFGFEAAWRHDNAKDGTSDLKDRVDALFVIPQEELAARLSQEDDSSTYDDVFHLADAALDESVQAVASVMALPEVANLHFSPVGALSSRPGIAWLGVGVEATAKAEPKAAA